MAYSSMRIITKHQTAVLADGGYVMCLNVFRNSFYFFNFNIS